MSTQLTFQGVCLNPIQKEAQLWITAPEVANALGYAREDSVSRIYDRNKDEFSSAMTETVNLTVSGNLQKTVRIFSLRGCHLVAMFARTAVAKEFRKWVLDVLDKEAQPQPAKAQNDRQSTATQLIPLRQKVEQLITTGVGNIYGDIWKLVHNKFEVKTIGQLKPEQIPEAIQYLYEIEGEYISKNQKKTIEIPDFRYQRILLTVENGEVTSTRMVGSDEMLMNRYQYINYFKEPDVGFNDVEQLAELSRTVSERLHKQLGKCR
ncbi:Bro-N domain-containing protein [Vibrio cholerae]|nr:hypothetical protein [Vibrio cholerae]